MGESVRRGAVGGLAVTLSALLVAMGAQTSLGNDPGVASSVEAAAEPGTDSVDLLRPIERSQWGEYVLVEGVGDGAVADVSVIEDAAMRGAVLVRLNDGTRAVLAPGATLEVEPKREIREGVFESAVSIVGLPESSARLTSPLAVPLGSGADPAAARLDLHERIGMIPSDVADEIRCSWFGRDCDDVDPAPSEAALDGQAIVLAQAGDPTSSGTHFGGDCIYAEQYAFWQYGCYDRYRGPTGSFSGKSGQFFGEISRQSAAGRGTGYLFTSGQEISYSGSGVVTNWNPTSTASYGACQSVTVGGTARGLSLKIPIQLCDKHRLSHLSSKKHGTDFHFAGGRRETRGSGATTWAHKASGAADMGLRFRIYRTYSNF